MDKWLHKCRPPIANICCHFYIVGRMNGMNITINSDLIETVEDTPDTVITLTTGRKIIVKESRQTIKNLVKSFKRECTFME